MAFHAEDARVDEQIDARHGRVEPVPRRREDPVAIRRRQILGVAQRAIDDEDMLEVALDERVNDRSRRPARPDDESQAPAIVPPRRRFVQVPQKAGDVGVVAPQEPVLAPKRIHGAERLRDRSSAVAGSERRHLVRHRDVRADQAVLSDPGRELGEGARRHRKPLVTGLDPAQIEPELMDHRRARMFDRPTRHPGPGRALDVVIARPVLRP